MIRNIKYEIILTYLSHTYTKQWKHKPRSWVLNYKPSSTENLPKDTDPKSPRILPKDSNSRVVFPGIENEISLYDLEYNNLKHFSKLRHSLENEYVATASKRVEDFILAATEFLKENPDFVILASSHGCMTEFLSLERGLTMEKFFYCGTSKFVLNQSSGKLDMQYFNQKFY